METYHARRDPKDAPPPLYQRQVITRLNCEENLMHAEPMMLTINAATLLIVDRVLTLKAMQVKQE